MSLTLIGLGLFDENDLSLRAIDEAKNSDKVYIELYTGKWYGTLDNLEKIVGKKVIQVGRKDLEENSKNIIVESKTKRVVILVEGDPLIATTHSSLILDTRKLGIETKVIHNASIVSVLGETGLHIYKFGPIATISFPEKTKGKLPKSIFKLVQENKKRDLHTLCLLDIDSEKNKFMTINEGIEILLGKAINKNEKLIGFAKAGSHKSIVVYDTVENLIRKKISDTPAVIIIPGKLHFTEEEFLASIS